MTLKELLYKRLSQSEEFTKYLSRYAESPAVFSTPPDEEDDGWMKGITHYPMAVFNIDLQASEERKSVGTLLVSLLCQNSEDVEPEIIEGKLKNCLKDILLSPDGCSVYAFAWARTDSFEITEKKNDLVIGCDVRFDILEYTSQETSDPDPILATGAYIRKLYPNCRVIGLDVLEDITEASNNQPVIYCRLNAVEKAEETNTVAWMVGDIAIHILCPDNIIRLKMIEDITNTLSLDGEIIMLDKSPMFLKQLQMDNKSDYLKDGQIFIKGRYGLLRYKPKPPALNHAILNL